MGNRKTKYNKSNAILWISYELWNYGRIKKSRIHEVLEIDNRITIYSYINEIKAFIADFDYYLDYSIEVVYDLETGYYVLEKTKKVLK